MATVKLTKEQLTLLDSLLYDHMANGGYWGSEKRHYSLVDATRKIIVAALRKG